MRFLCASFSLELCANYKLHGYFWNVVYIEIAQVSATIIGLIPLDPWILSPTPDLVRFDVSEPDQSYDARSHRLISTRQSSCRPLSLRYPFSRVWVFVCFSPDVYIMYLLPYDKRKSFPFRVGPSKRGIKSELLTNRFSWAVFAPADELFIPRKCF